jgi:hypothetical protein
MHYLLLAYSFCFLIFLYTLYHIGKEDTLFIRKGISMEQVFNIAFILLFVSVISSKLGFTLLNWQAKYLNPLTILWSDFFREVSLISGLIGSVIGLYLFCKNKKLPFSRLIDFLSLSLMVMVPFAIFVTFLLSPKTDYMLGGILVFLSILFALFFFRLLFPQLLRGNLREGNIGILTLMSLSLLLLFNNIVISIETQKAFITVENGLVCVTAAIFFLLLLRQEIGKKKVVKHG